MKYKFRTFVSFIYFNFCKLIILCFWYFINNHRPSNKKPRGERKTDNKKKEKNLFQRGYDYE